MSIITYPLNGVTYNATDAETYLCTRTSGVFSSNGHFAISISGSRSVTIGTGLAWINNDAYCGKSICVNEPVQLDIAVADQSLPRIDRIVLRFNAASNKSEIVILKGTPASNPVAPEFSRTAIMYDLVLYDIRVPELSSNVSFEHIRSRILDEQMCGIMRDGVTAIPTAAIEAQAQAVLKHLEETLAAVASGSGLMLSTIYDSDGDGSVNMADVAKSLSATLPIERGGTGTTSVDGIKNLLGIRTAQNVDGGTSELVTAAQVKDFVMRYVAEEINHIINFENRRF